MTCGNGSPSHRELVFCGFGEPMFRTDDILWLVDRLKEEVPGLPRCASTRTDTPT